MAGLDPTLPGKVFAAAKFGDSRPTTSETVMAGLDPAIHAVTFRILWKHPRCGAAWVAVSSTAMTVLARWVAGLDPLLSGKVLPLQNSGLSANNP